MKPGILCPELSLTCSKTQAELSRLSEIENSLAIFCMATYGEGDPTDNAQDFYDWLQENGEEDLSGVNFTVSYTCNFSHYCTIHINHNHHTTPKSRKLTSSLPRLTHAYKGLTLNQIQSQVKLTPSVLWR